MAILISILCMALVLPSGLIYSTTSNEVYTIAKHSSSVRAHGLGYTFTSIANDESATLVNPAGLSYPGSAYSFQKLDYDKIDYRTNQAHFYYKRPFGFASVIHQDLSGNKLTMNAIGLGIFGSNGISWGVTYKSIYGNVDSNSVKGWSSDFGLMFRLFPWLNLGANIKDIYSKDLNLNPTSHIGISGIHNEGLFVWSLQTHFENNEKKYMYTSLGGELTLSPSLSVRSGVSETTVFSGITLRLPFIKFEFAMSNNLGISDGTKYSVATTIGPGSQFNQYRKRYALFTKDAYAEFSVGGQLKKGRSQISLLGGYKIGSNDLITLIHMANQDPSCKGFIVRIGNIAASITSVGLVEEIRTELLKAKKSGKSVFVYIEAGAGLPEYYLASIADVIIMPPLGTISQFGLEIEIKKAADFLRKLGINPEIFNTGIHKSSTGLTSDALSLLSKNHLQTLIETMFNTVVADIEASRETSKNSIHKISDGSMITAIKAKEIGLVDRLAYWPDVYDIVDSYDKNVQKLTIQEFASLKYPSIFQLMNKIGIIEVDGKILLGSNRSSLIFGSESTGADEFDTLINTVKKDKSIKGVILRINSPGGSVLASDRMLSAIERLKQSGKKVYTSMGSIATSGGYYIAANSDKIYANKSSITGSIGVISSKISFESLTHELSIKRHTLKTGKYMDLFSSFNQLDEQEKKLLIDYQDKFYQTFVNKVQQHRSLTHSEVYMIAQGQLLAGNQAHQLKMVDKIGGLYDAVDDLAKELKIKTPEVVYLQSKSRFALPFLNTTFSSHISSILEQGLLSIFKK